MADAPAQAFLESLSAGGGCGRLVASRDWSSTPLGPIGMWPQSLRGATSLLLRSPVPMVMLWGEDGVMLYNDAYSVFAGGRHPDLLGSKVREGWPEVAAFNDNVMRVGLAGGTLSYRDQELTLYRHGHPEQVWMDLSYSPVLDECYRPAGVLCVLAETTERVAAERELKTSEARLKAVFTQAGAGLALTDLSGRFSDVNETYCAMVGHSREQVLGLTMQAMTHPDDLARNAPLFEAAARHGTAFDIEKRYLRPDGGSVWVRNTVSAVRADDGTVDAILAVSVDITARVQAEAALRESEARQRALIEGVPQLVWRAVGAGKWTWASPQWTAYTGQPEPQSRGLGWLRPIHPDDRGRALDAWSKAASLGAFHVEFRLLNAAEDRYGWFQARAVPVRDTDGRIREWLGTSTDIDHLRRLQEQQGVMVAELQHRTRNLIAVVTSIAHETLAQTGPGDTFVAQFDDRLAALSRVQSLLSRAVESPITIEALVRMELQALGVSERHVGLHGPPVPLRPSTVQTLALAVHELATNARKYGALSTPRGTLSVGWRVRDEDEAGGVRHWLAIDWIETGIAPPVPETSHRGYGRELIEEALPFALGARTRYILDARGVRCRIELPLDPRCARETARETTRETRA